MTSKVTTLKCLPPSVRPTLVMFLILIPTLCSAIKVNCSQPNQPALMEALTPVFNLSAIRPVMNMTTCTNVSTFFTMYGILGVEEKTQLLITYIWLNYWWMNELVSWDPIQCGTNKISLPRDNFWVPDIVINEFMDENTAPFVPYVYLYNDGWIHNALPVKVVSSCNLDIYTFPFDIQNCTLTFNSYIHLAMDIKIFLGKSAEKITQNSKEVMTTMGEWELLEITSHKPSTGLDDHDYIDELAFHIRVRRRATLYVVNLLIPSCFLITVDLFSFLLPPQSVDRSSFKMTLILGYTVFLLIMNDLLPITGDTIPLINVFFSICLALMVASLLETILITNLLYGSADFSPVPCWVRVFVLQILGCFVCLPQKTKEPKDSDMKPVVAKRKADEGPPKDQGPAVEDKALQEMRSLGMDLQAIRLQVEQQLGGSQKSEEWIQCCPLKVRPSKVLFIFISVLMHAPCSSIMLNCSQPDPPSLLEALRPVFSLSSIRPVMDMSTPTNVNISFTLYGILGVDEKAQVLTTFIWQSLKWRNEFVRWDPEQCGSSQITIPRKLLWVPDVVINEFMEKNSAPFVPYSYLFSDGLVLDDQPVKVVSSCRLDIYMFPFDIQNCSLSFNSYLHSNRFEAPGHPVCGEPADPQLLPHHSGPLQLPAASPECRPILLQDDPHPGLHSLPAHHERPAAYHWRHHTSHKCVPDSLPGYDGGKSTGDYNHHQPAVWLRSLLSSPSLGPSVCSSHPGPPGMASSKAQRSRGHCHPKFCCTRNESLLSGGRGQQGFRTEGNAG
ncbi:5-hydroxytryptamine receptor 3A-like isoform X2 [Siniperca chuatsi]|uniref:5-hydroxytryptamine receptor 3A-like isoform X2 n=1 Tax=Siniperca chuatsi TaxID=119488 RepID=UPI001CE0B507|nr:5-hydroxytryptamine receptor 3A-like isoform X2 [Siniperca chuatsi]